MFLKQFIYKTLIIVLISVFVCVVVFKVYFPTKFLLFYAFLPVLFGLINVLIFRFLIKSGDTALLKFTNRYLLCTTVKLLGSLLFIVVFLILYKSHAVPFLLTFLVFYLVFLAQEILGILNFFKKKTNSETTQAKT